MNNFFQEKKSRFFLFFLYTVIRKIFFYINIKHMEEVILSKIDTKITLKYILEKNESVIFERK